MNFEDFESFGLDDRIIAALGDAGFSKPTLVQQQAIPIAMEHKDVLVRAPTGVGKTLCYAIPVVQSLLKEANRIGTVSQALILVPSKELCAQALQTIQGLCKYASDRLKPMGLGLSGSTFQSEKLRLKDFPSIIISTPTQIVKHLKAKTLDLTSSLRMLVIDEGDLILSYGHEKEIELLTQYIPQSIQTMLISATLSSEIDVLKQLVLRNPVVIKLSLKETQDASQLKNYYIDMKEAPDRDLYLYVYALLKLEFLTGKTLVFVNNIERGFQLKLFLEAFCMPSAVLNSELPIASRLRIVDQFNVGMFDLLIATDDFDKEESGVSRGVDFRNISNVVNFDFPKSLKSFIHRVGRSARGSNKGTSLSFFRETVDSMDTFLKIQEYYEIEEGVFELLDLPTDELSNFRYRVEDILRGVTKAAVKEARVNELKIEMLNSDKLKAHFEDNPKELRLLKHDKVLRPKSVMKHLKGIPQYLMPKHIQTVSQPISAVQKERGSYRKRQKRKHQMMARKDPLKSFKVSSIPRVGEMHRLSKKSRK